MATDLETLTASYLSVFRKLPDATDAAYLASLVASITPGRVGGSLATATQSVAYRSIASTEVGVLAYGFFTGLSLRVTGLDYLLSATGGNPNNLNSSYYAAFNAENRYINFAKNLGAIGEGAAAFQVGYGGLTLQQAAAKAYAAIFGTSATPPSDLLTAVVPNGQGGTYTRADYFASYGGDGLNGQGTKAALVGWLLSEAAKIHAGPYVAAAEAYLTDLAGDGQAQFGVDLLATYGPGGDYAPGGRLDPGLPGSVIDIARDTTLKLFYSSGAEPVHASTAVSTSGNDVVVSTTGLVGDNALTFGVAQPIQLGGGNDTLTVSGGLASRTVDAGAGNDRLSFSAFNGTITTGTGFDTVVIVAFTSQTVPDNGASVTPSITDFTRGQDVLTFADALGPGRVSPVDVRGAATLDAALVTIAANTAANANTVFEYGGSTYVFHQNADPALNIGAALGSDGLLKLVGVAGVTLDARDGRAYDIHFGS